MLLNKNSRCLPLVLFLGASLLPQVRAEYDHFVSPDGKFEAYTTGNLPNGSGMKMYLRYRNSRDPGVLLWQNDRWIEPKWSPDSHLLAMIDHPDGHVSDVYVFGVTAADPLEVRLYYHTPDPFTYDVQWKLIRWRARHREIVLRQEVRDQNAHTFATHIVTAKVGTEALPFQRP